VEIFDASKFTVIKSKPNRFGNLEIAEAIRIISGATSINAALLVRKGARITSIKNFIKKR